MSKNNVLTEEKSFLSPFTPSYWYAAFMEFKNVKTMAVVSMLLAASVVIGAFIRIPIPVRENLNILFDFIPNAIACAICGPIVGIVYGFLADIIGYVINPWGAYFPGYTLSSILVMLIFSLFFYRRKISVWRILVAKFLYNALINVVLGSVWTAMMFSKGYIVYFWSGLIKNAILYPIESAILLIVFASMIPVMSRLGLIPTQKTIAIPSIKKLFSRSKEKELDRV